MIAKLRDVKNLVNCVLFSVTFWVSLEIFSLAFNSKQHF